MARQNAISFISGVFMTVHLDSTSQDITTRQNTQFSSQLFTVSHSLNVELIAHPFLTLAWWHTSGSQSIQYNNKLHVFKVAKYITLHCIVIILIRSDNNIMF